jgi:perosamine synthetase
MKVLIPHSRPTLNSRDAAAVAGVVNSGYVSEGPEVMKFERAFARYQGQKGAVALNSGTAALHLALRALGVGKGDEVIIPSYVCTALLNAILYTQARPRVVDVHFEDGNMATHAVGKNITKKVKAMIVPHMFGQPADMKELMEFGVPLIEDCAQAVGASYGNKRAGSLGAAGVFSFYATKMMTTGEGGMVTAGEAGLLKRIRDAHDYDHKKEYHIRYNYKMTDIQAALGQAQLARLPEMIRRRQQIADHYTCVLSSEDVQLPARVKGKDPVFFRYVIKVQRNRERMIRYLEAKRIRGAAPVFRPIHAYLKKKGFPNTERLMREALSIPLYPSLTGQQVDYIAQNVRAAVQKFG